jgi:hypothetical protein
MASRGNYSNTVKLSWQVNQVGTGECYFTLQRRPLGTAGNNGWATIYTTHGTATTYSYDDETAQTGSFNEYKLILSENVSGTVKATDQKTCDGFCMGFGTMSGRISFGSGTAVQDAKVTLRPQDTDGNKMNHFRSLYFNGLSTSGFTCPLTTEEKKNVFGGDFTIQMWVNPDLQKMTKGYDHSIFQLGDLSAFYISVNPQGSNYDVSTSVNGSKKYTLNVSSKRPKPFVIYLDIAA